MIMITCDLLGMLYVNIYKLHENMIKLHIALINFA